ncbi:putative LuxR-family transcriptional regulator [Marinobacterium lacunae]|uniref:Putative LuxR-family transcriptional regulator n=1 Tax=Marinobacterium lacunae TaxID=1232683 RepID=A0A081FXD4_9GAMM|nr:response regulator transcription factor [Marinobacterium lacunae]KEA63189.1 putative LuxR-family transcriptional regulator [Marinobacterium lacunae]MBR9884671.1 response regulator transcription factor [Oceanospirillales bacterium]
MDYFCIAMRDDIAQRWTEALDLNLNRLEQPLSSVALPQNGLCLAHWQSISGAEKELLLAHAHGCGLSLVVLTDHPDTDEGRELIRRGAKAYGNTFVTYSLLNEMIKAVKRGDIWAGQDVLQSVLRQLLEQVEPPVQSLAERYGLSDRENEVLVEVMSGASNKVVARRLDITERTVKAHMSAILNKTGARDRVELILLAQRTERNAV